MSKKLNSQYFIKSIVLVFCTALAEQTSASSSLDLAGVMSDRYEHNCAIRKALDLLHYNNVSDSLSRHVLKQKEHANSVFTTLSLNLERVYYRNIPVVKMDYVLHAKSRYQQQILYLDLTSVTARQNFSRIQFNNNRGKLEIDRDGRFTLLRCSW